MMATKPRKARGRPSYEDLVNDETQWDMPTIAEQLDVQYQTVKSWRKDYRRALSAEVTTPKPGQPAVPHPKLLPPPDEVVFGKPVWKAGTIRRWAMQTGRMTPDGTPVKQKPPGRPRKQPS